MSTTRCCGSFPPEQSITNRRFGTPTCTAARPTPGAAYMVSNILLTSFSKSVSNSVTGSAGLSSTGAGHFTISSTAMAVILNYKTDSKLIPSQLLAIAIKVALHLADTVAAELLPHRTRDHKRDHRLANYTRSRHCRHI